MAIWEGRKGGGKRGRRRYIWLPLNAFTKNVKKSQCKSKFAMALKTLAVSHKHTHTHTYTLTFILTQSH